MKPFSILLISAASLLWISCKKESNPDPAEPYLNKITELRYLPDDSVTVAYTFDRDGLLTQEKNSRNFSIKGFRNSEETSRLTAGSIYYRLYTYNLSNQQVKFEEFRATSAPRKHFVSDTSMYENNKLIKKELRSFWFEIPGDGDVLFNYPLWVTKRYFKYDSQNRISTETDSVFICHDIRKVIGIVEKTEPRFVYTTNTKNNYNTKNELIEKITSTTKNSMLFYEDGRSVFGYTNPGRIYPGSVIYSYQYNTLNQLITKTATFTNAHDDKVYKSIFNYSYGQ